MLAVVAIVLLIIMTSLPEPTALMEEEIISAMSPAQKWAKHKEKRWKNKLSLLFWVWEELEKVEEYEQNDPKSLLEELIITKRPVGRPPKPKIANKLEKKEFDWKKYIKAWAAVNQRRPNKARERFLAGGKWKKKKENKDGKSSKTK